MQAPSGPGAPGAAGAGRSARAPGPAPLRFVSAEGTAPLPLCGRGAGPTGGISCSAGAWPGTFGTCSLRAGHGGGGKARAFGDAESPRGKRGRLGPSVDCAPSEHLQKGPAEAWSGWEEGSVPGTLGSQPSWPLQGLVFSLLPGAFWALCRRRPGDKSLIALEPGAKDSRVGLVCASPREERAFWEGDSMGKDAGPCVLSLLEDTFDRKNSEA